MDSQKKDKARVNKKQAQRLLTRIFKKFSRPLACGRRLKLAL